MLPRRVIQPKTYVLAIKTHKLTLYLDVTHPDSTMISDLKDQALTALKAEVLTADHDGDIDMSEWTVPTIESVDDFELSRAVREKGRPTGTYEVMQPKTFIRHCLSAWEHIFIQFKDADGNLLPVKVSLPALVEDDDDEPELSAVQRGKRKADTQADTP